MRIGNRIVTQNIFGGQVILPATEAADDLTSETKTMMRNTVSASRQDNPDPMDASMNEPTTTSDETADANGANDNPNDMSMDPNSVPEAGDGMGGDDPFGAGDDGGGDDPFGGGGDNGGMGGDDGMGGDGFGDEPTPEQARLMATLQSNINSIADSIEGLMNGLNDYAAPSASQEVRSIYTTAIVQLNRLNEMVKSLNEHALTIKTYPAKLRTFASIRHAYGLVIEEIAIHFDAVDTENGRPLDSDK